MYIYLSTKYFSNDLLLHSFLFPFWKKRITNCDSLGGDSLTLIFSFVHLMEILRWFFFFFSRLLFFPLIIFFTSEQDPSFSLPFEEHRPALRLRFLKVTNFYCIYPPAYVPNRLACLDGWACYHVFRCSWATPIASLSQLQVCCTFFFFWSKSLLHFHVKDIIYFFFFFKDIIYPRWVSSKKQNIRGYLITEVLTPWTTN